MKVGVLIEFTSDTDIDAKFAELKEMGMVAGMSARRCLFTGETGQVMLGGL